MPVSVTSTSPKRSIILTVIGGGSVNWMPGLMRDLYLLDELDGGEIRLVDPNREQAEAVAALLNRYNEQRQKTYRISVCDNRREALSGADFVMTTFSPGSMEAYWADLELPVKYGLCLPVSMTVGIPGISAVLRTVPVAFELVQEMETLCPGAHLLNVTNPMTAVTAAMNRAARRTRVLGLCHEFHGFDQIAGNVFGLDCPEGMDAPDYLYGWLQEQGLEYTVAGINHFIWLTAGTFRGRDIIPMVRDYCATHHDFPKRATAGGQATTNFPHNHGEAKVQLCRQYGYLPLVGDRHLVEFVPALCNAQTGYGMRYNVRKTTLDLRRSVIARKLTSVLRMTDGTEPVKWVKTGEELAGIIRAVVTGTPCTAIVNLPNQGQVTNMPIGSVVETLATVTPEATVARSSGALPGAIGSLCRLHSDVLQLASQAALDGDRRLLVEAMSLDPSSACMNFSDIPLLADELLNANRQWLPRFFAN